MKEFEEDSVKTFITNDVLNSKDFSSMSTDKLIHIISTKTNNNDLTKKQLKLFRKKQQQKIKKNAKLLFNINNQKQITQGTLHVSHTKITYSKFYILTMYLHFHERFD